MNEDVKEAIAFTEKWHRKITEIAIGYEKAIAILAEVREDYKKTKIWTTVLNWLLPLLSIIIVLLMLNIFLQHTCPNPVDIKFQGLELTQHCQGTK